MLVVKKLAVAADVHVLVLIVVEVIFVVEVNALVTVVEKPLL